VPEVGSAHRGDWGPHRAILEDRSAARRGSRGGRGVGGLSFGPHALGTGAGSAKTGFHEIEVSRHIDKLSAKLQLDFAKVDIRLKK
jgi:hypothetical protein